MYRLFLLFFLFCLGKGFAWAQNVEWAMTGLSYNSAGPFCNGIATIGSEYDKKTKLIDRNGREIGEANGKIVYADDSNRIILKGGSFSYYLTDSNGKILSKECNQIIPWRNCFACENKKGKWALTDRNGKLLLKYSDYYFMDYKGDYADFSNDGVSMVFNADGQLVLKDEGIQQWVLTDASPIIYGTNRLYIKSSGKTMELKDKLIDCHALCDYFVLTDPKEGKREYFDFNCQPIKESSLASNRLGITVVPVNGKYMLTDASGNRISTELFDDVHPLLWVDGILTVKCDDKWGYISEEGKWIVRPQYKTADPFAWGVAMVNRNAFSSNPKLIDVKGNTLLKFPEDIIQYFIVQVNGMPLLFYEISSISSSRGFYNLTTRKGVGKLDMMPDFQGDYTVVSSNHKKGVCRSNGELVLPCKYDMVKYISEGVIVVDDNLKDKIFDLQGNLKLDGSQLGITVKGPFSSGVAPVFVSGVEKGAEGYIYNIYGCTLEETLSSFGKLGDAPVSEEMKNLIQQRQYFVNYHQNMGEKAMQQKQYDVAIHHFDRVIAVYSLYSPALYGKGVCMMEKGNNSEAIACLEKSMIGNPLQDGGRYTLALCYYQDGDYAKAIKNCNRVSTKDTYYNEAQQLKNEINNRQQMKRQQRMEMFIAIMNGLNQVAGTLQSMQQNNVSGSAVSPSHNRTVNSGAKQRECTSCHGTGYSSGRERPAFYNYDEEIYENAPCEICGSRSNHYHKPCPVCRGKGYVNF